MNTHLEFLNRKRVPRCGLGTWQSVNPEELERAIDAALKYGYRYIDTAYNYLNEDKIGFALKKWFDSGKLKREDIFVTSKLPMIAMKPDSVGEFLSKSLNKLQLDYVDLYLIHFPFGFQYTTDTDILPKQDGKLLFDMSSDLLAVWAALEKEVDAGKIKSLGVSNFNSKQIERIFNSARIKPVNLQVELHAYFQQKNLVEFCKKLNMTVTSYASMGSPGRKELWLKRGLVFESPNIMEDETVIKISEKYNKTPAQILLRFLAQNDIIVIPKSVNPERIKANFDIFDFEISPEDMESLISLDKGPEGRSFDFTVFPGGEEHPEWPLKEPF